MTNTELPTSERTGATTDPPDRVGVVLAGGGTAGHVNPLLAVADALRRRDPDIEILVLGTEEGLESELVPARGYPLWTIPRTPLPREPTLDYFRLPGKFKKAYRSAAEAIESVTASVVVGFGGYVSTPAYLAAHRLGVPIVVHEGNARAGLSNRIGARWAERVAVTFPTTKLAHANVDGQTGAELVGLPMRAEITELAGKRDRDPVGLRASAATELGLDPTMPTLLVSGGSTGALSINTAVAAAASYLIEAGIQVLHLTGKGKDAAVREKLAKLISAAEDEDNVLAGQLRDNYHIREYLPEMQLALACADLVITRAGAGMVCELSALGIPAIYVPLPFGNGEQRKNALPLVEAGGGMLVKDDDFTPQWVRSQVPELIGDPERLAAMSTSARAQGRPDAADELAEIIEEVIARGTKPSPSSGEHGSGPTTDEHGAVPSSDEHGAVPSSDEHESGPTPDVPEEL